MKVEDCYMQGRRLWVRLHEKGGKRHEVPANHHLDEYLEAYLEAADLKGQPKSALFRSAAGRTGHLSENAMTQPDVYRMIRRRAEAGGIKTKIGCHTFRATGITAYLKNGGRLEVAQQIAAHESSRTTGLPALIADCFQVHHIDPLAAHFASRNPKYLDEFRAAVSKAHAHVINLCLGSCHVALNS